MSEMCQSGIRQRHSPSQSLKVMDSYYLIDTIEASGGTIESLSQETFANQKYLKIL